MESDMAYRVTKPFRFNDPDGVQTEYKPGEIVAKAHAEHVFISKHLADGRVEDMDQIAAAERAAVAEADKKAAAAKAEEKAAADRATAEAFAAEQAAKSKK